MNTPYRYARFIIVMLFFAYQNNYAQTRTIMGTVINGVTGKPISGIAVEIKGGGQWLKARQPEIIL